MALAIETPTRWPPRSRHALPRLLLLVSVSAGCGNSAPPPKSPAAPSATPAVGAPIVAADDPATGSQEDPAEVEATQITPANRAAFMSPDLVEARRIEGSKYLPPDERTKIAMVKHHRNSVSAAFHVCIDPTGHVASVDLLATSGFHEYDEELVAELRQWVYRPMVVGGKTVPICTSVRFVYGQR